MKRHLRKILFFIVSLGVGVIFGLSLNNLILYKDTAPVGTPATQPETVTKIEGVPFSKNGFMYFEYENTNREGVDNGLIVRLKFWASDSGVIQTIKEFRGAMDMVYPLSLYTFHGNKIYFVDKDGQLLSLSDPFAEPSRLDIGLAPGEFISDYHFTNNELYYLAGPFCNEYRGQCNNTLRVVDVYSGNIKTLASEIDKPTIQGLSKDHSKLFLTGGFGDAGCYFITTSAYKIREITLEEGESFSVCSGDPNEAEVERKYRAFQAEVEKQEELPDRLDWKDGKLSLPSEISKKIDIDAESIDY